MQGKKPGFLKGWLIYSSIGWAIGGLIGIASIDSFPLITYLSTFDTPFEQARAHVLSSLVLWLPLGVSVSVWQWLKLRPWHVSGPAWILGTSLAWFLPPAFLPLIVDMLHVPSFESWTSDGQAAQLLLMILAVATVQAVILHFSKPISALWVAAYFLGSMVLVVLAVLTWGIGFGVGKSLIPFLKQQGELGFEIISNREILLLALVYLFAPLWAVICIGLPTGLILRKYFLPEESSEGPTYGQLPTR